jgi:hypothetical protein
MSIIKIGTVVKLKVNCMGCKKGDIGVCYDEYYIGHSGVSIIFENGDYDGFDEYEQKNFLEIIKHTGLQYKFTNVLQLSKDFSNGYFNQYLRKEIKGE